MQPPLVVRVYRSVLCHSQCGRPFLVSTFSGRSLLPGARMVSLRCWLGGACIWLQCLLLPLFHAKLRWASAPRLHLRKSWGGRREIRPGSRGAPSPNYPGPDPDFPDGSFSSVPASSVATGAKYRVDGTVLLSSKGIKSSWGTCFEWPGSSLFPAPQSCESGHHV